MSDDRAKRRREGRLSVQATANVEANRTGQTAQAATVNISASGALFHLDDPMSLAPGDQVSCDFLPGRDPDVPLPFWGLGRIVRVEAGSVAVELQNAASARFDPRSPAWSVPTGEPL